MAEEIDFENGRTYNFQRHVTLSLTLDRAIHYIVMHHSSTSIYIPNFIGIRETFCGWTDIETGFIRSTQRLNIMDSEPTNGKLFCVNQQHVSIHQPKQHIQIYTIIMFPH